MATGAYNLLLKRSAYLTAGRYLEMEWTDLVEAYQDLVSFVSGLQHGQHFAGILARRISPPHMPSLLRVTVIGVGCDLDEQDRQQEREREEFLRAKTLEFREKLDAACASILETLDEILLAQDER